MKTCPNCGASNADAMKFCGECGSALSPAESLREKPVGASVGGKVDAASLAKSIATKGALLQGKGRKADIMFALDCTGSMQGEIDAIKDAIMSFADTIESDGVRVQVGMIAFRDRLIGEEPQVLGFSSGPFTKDPAEFRRQVSLLKASGGGDEPESSLDAVMLALRQPFSPDSNKVIVLITDAPPHVPDKDTKSVEEVVQTIRGTGIQQFYVVMRTNDPNSQVYLKFLEGTRGVAFELGTGNDFRSRAEDFKRTLMALGKTISAATR